MTTTRKKRKTKLCLPQPNPCGPAAVRCAPCRSAASTSTLEAVDFKNVELLKKFLTEKGRILPRRITGMTAKMHRKLTTEIKRARNVLLVK